MLAFGMWSHQVSSRREAKYSLECIEKGIQWDKAHNVEEPPVPSDRAQSTTPACSDADVQRAFIEDSDIVISLAGIVFAILATPWLWAFLLRRLAEVSKALAGKPPDAQ